METSELCCAQTESPRIGTQSPDYVSPRNRPGAVYRSLVGSAADDSASSTGNGMVASNRPGWLRDSQSSSPKSACSDDEQYRSAATLPLSPVLVTLSPNVVGTGKGCADPSKLPILPPCRVCSYPASGFHYGVNTCEACKGFFHRSLQRKVSYTCLKSGICDVRLSERNSCAACRFQRCLRAGMRKEGVKTGRYTHQRRTCDTLEIKRIQSIFSMHNAEAVQSASTVNRMATAFTECFQGTSLFYTNPGRIEAMKKTLLLKHNTKHVTRVLLGDGCLTVGAAASGAIPATGVLPDCDALFSIISGDGCDANNGPGAGLIYDAWNREMELVIRALVKFAKSVPGYSQLSLQDQIVLLKASRAELSLLVKHKAFDPSLSCLADVRGNTIMLIPSRFMLLLWDDDDYAERCLQSTRRLQSMALSVADVALLMAVALLSPDRDGLTDAAAVGAAQEALLPALRRSIGASHPHELSVHAEALLSLAQLREISEHNSRVMADLYQRSPAGFVPLVMECLQQKVFQQK